MENLRQLAIPANPVGNETQFIVGNPYRRIRFDERGLYTIQKGNKVYWQGES